jgi:hypothetical protein
MARGTEEVVMASCTVIGTFLVSGPLTWAR